MIAIEDSMRNRLIEVIYRNSVYRSVDDNDGVLDMPLLVYVDSEVLKAEQNTYISITKTIGESMREISS
jgi:hypothetical protein